jgi:hypothetical protein
MSAAERLAALDDLPASDLIGITEQTLATLVRIMNEETTLLRGGRHREAGKLTAEKTRLAQDYVSYSRAVQRQLERLKSEAPADIARLGSGHESLATQLAENLKVIATAHAVTEDLLTDVAHQVAKANRPKVYGATGTIAPPAAPTGGIAVNRAL